MRVRPARASDLAAIEAVARLAWYDTHIGLLKPSTIESFLDTAYSPAGLARRLADHPMFVAIDRRRLVGFADAYVEDDRVVLAVLYVDPPDRGLGAGRVLLARVRKLAPSLPISADVLLGNRSGETFYEGHGFVPGETLDGDLFGEPVVERRWWLPPLTPQSR